MLVLFIVYLRLALSIRTTPKGTGACFGIQESSALIFLLIVSLLAITVFPKGTGAFGNSRLCLQTILLSIPLPSIFLKSSKGMTLGNSIFMFAGCFCKLFYLS